MLRYFWLTCGFLSLTAGVIGIILPLLPTTPFILLAAASFAKSSTRFYYYLINNKTFGPIIISWQENRTIPPRAKIIMGSVMVVSITISIVYLTN